MTEVMEKLKCRLTIYKDMLASAERDLEQAKAQVAAAETRIQVNKTTINELQYLLELYHEQQ